MTTLIYNGVELRNCETKVFSQQVVYDESNTDVVYSKFRLRVSSTLVSYRPDVADHTSTLGVPDQQLVLTSASTLTPVSSLTVAGTTPERIRRIHQRLSEKARLLYYFIPRAPHSGTPLEVDPGPEATDIMLIAAGPFELDPTQPAAVPPTILLHPDYPDGTRIDPRTVVDVENGPKPTHVSVDQIFGGRAMRVTFEVEVARRLCAVVPNDSTDPYPFSEPNIDAAEDDPGTLDVNEEQSERKIKPSTKILNNRWHVTETKDATWHTTRILQGTLRVKEKNVIPHLMRYLVMPPLLRGYQRVSQTYADDPTGLVLKYRIEDRERHDAPPAPAIDWQGHFALSSTNFGLQTIAELSVRLTGPPGVDKQELIGAAGRVITARMKDVQKDPADPEFKHNVRILGSSVVEILGEPVIEMSVQARYNDTSPRYLTTHLKLIGEPLNKNQVDPPDPDTKYSIDDYFPDEWPSPLPYDSESPSGIFSCYLQHPCSRWHTPVMWEEERATPYPAEGETETARSKYLTRTKEDLDADVRTYSSYDAFPEEDKLRIADEQFEDFPYTYIEIHTEYKTEPGYVQLPLSIAEPAPTSPSAPPLERTCALVKIHGGLTRRLFRMTARRSGKIPVLPEPKHEITDVNNIKEVLLDQRIGIASPEFGPDGLTREYQIAAEYVYALSRPPTNSEKLRMAISPIDATPDETKLVDQQDLFTDELIEWPAPPPSPPTP